MKKEDAELKANALSKNLVKKEAVHTGSQFKCIIASVEAVAKKEDDQDYDVYCFFHPIDHKVNSRNLKEEIDYFLANYKIANIPLQTHSETIA